MTQSPRLMDVDINNFDALPCCGIKSASHPGRVEKRCWLESNAASGVRGKVIIAPGGKQAGYIEYVPGEFAWRGVDARGYLFIHCIWMHSRQYQRKGWGSLLVKACIDEAKAAGMEGVAVMVRESPWIADRRLFLANGFECVDAAPPDYQLLVRKFQAGATNPAFQKGWDERVAKYGRGLTIIRAAQCPYVAKFSAEIIESAKEEYGIKPKVVELRSARDAQNAPTPYATFALIYDGKLVADHQISRTRFRNIMRKVTA